MATSTQRYFTRKNGKKVKAGLDSAINIQALVSHKDSTPKIVGAKGSLPAKKTAQIMRELESNVSPPDIVQRQAILLEELSERPLYAGNKVTLLTDGPETYRAMLAAIRKARHHIHLEVYWFKHGRAGKKFSDLLLKKRAEGVEVCVIYDSVGSILTEKALFEKLKSGGVKLCEFNPIRRKTFLPFTCRDHRKIMVVDGKIGFIGGININDDYLIRLPKRKKQNRDYYVRDAHVQIEGPSVSELQRFFLETWMKQKGENLKGRYFPRLEEKGMDFVRILASSPESERPYTYLMYVSAFAYARHSIYLSAAYFVPNEHIMNAITSAASRGVDVRIFLPGATDSRLTLYAGRSYYAPLLKAGVRLYEYRQDGMMHAKAAVIDGVWSTVGSTNIDSISFLKNDEANAVILSKDFAAVMQKQFQEDIHAAREITQEDILDRNALTRLIQAFARLVGYWL
jgi:cardiolipin synthase A/B